MDLGVLYTSDDLLLCQIFSQKLEWCLCTFQLAHDDQGSDNWHTWTTQCHLSGVLNIYRKAAFTIWRRLKRGLQGCVGDWLFCVDNVLLDSSVCWHCVFVGFFLLTAVHVVSWYPMCGTSCHTIHHSSAKHVCCLLEMGTSRHTDFWIQTEDACKCLALTIVIKQSVAWGSYLFVGCVLAVCRHQWST